MIEVEWLSRSIYVTAIIPLKITILRYHLAKAELDPSECTTSVVLLRLAGQECVVQDDRFCIMPEDLGETIWRSHALPIQRLRSRG